MSYANPGDCERDGFVWVRSARCPTCPYTPGSEHAATAADMKRDADRTNTYHPCHETEYKDGVFPAICRGYYAHHRSNLLTLAEMTGQIKEVAL